MTLQAANAAREKAAHKHKIAAYVTQHYAETRKPVCQSDIITALKVCKATVNRAVKELQTEQKIHCIGTAADADRDDITANTRLYGPLSAPVIVRSSFNYTPQPQRTFWEKPPVRESAVKQPRYKGAVGNKYVPEFRPSSGREFWTHKELCLIARGRP